MIRSAGKEKEGTMIWVLDVHSDSLRQVACASINEGLETNGQSAFLPIDSSFLSVLQAREEYFAIVQFPHNFVTL